MNNKFNRAFFLSLALTLPLSVSLSATTYDWTGPGVDMTTAANWGGTVPTVTDLADFEGSAPLNPSVTETGTAKAFDVQGITFSTNSYTITVDGMNTLNGAEISVGNSAGPGVTNSAGVAETFNVVRGGVINFLPGSSADLTGSGMVTYNVGTNTDAVASSINLNDASGSNATINLTGNAANPANLEFTGTTTQGFGGTLTGTAGGSTVTKDGTGTIAFVSPAPAFLGTVNINGGNFNLNNFLGGNVNITQGIFSGNGQIGGNLTNAGIISPGNSIGTIVVGGNLTLSSSSIFNVQVNGAGQSSLLVVEGNAVVGGIVNVISLDGVINPANNYLIMHVDGTFKGFFEAVIAGNNRFVGEAFYVPDGTSTNVILKLESIFTFIAESANEMEIAAQLLSITNPSPEIDAVLDGIALLAAEDPALAAQVLDQLSGQQYTNLIIAAEISGHQFLRRLYDPIRSIVTTYPGCCDDYCCEQCPTFDLWLESGGGRTFIEGTRNTRGFHTDGYEITGGAQSTFNRAWTIGLAGSYSQDQVSYNVGGSGKNRYGYAGIYGLYRPANFYVLADGAFGYSENKLHRFISVGPTLLTAHSKPKIYQGSGYIEAGIDCPWNCILLQPFLGFEVGYYNRKGITETGLSPFNLSVSKKNHTNVFSRLGAHITTNQLPYNLSLSLDIAWQYRITSLDNSISERFQTFGDTFKIKGLHFRNSSIDASATISAVVWDNWEIYAEMSGERWYRASTYNFLGGVKYSW